ncbi:MAG: hypothetical protein ABI866_01535 [Dokdonella sp.]
MPVTFDADEFDSALRQLNQPMQAKPAPVLVAKSSATSKAIERSPSDELKVRIITARTKLKLMRDRSEALRDSLQRFRMQQRIATRA